MRTFGMIVTSCALALVVVAPASAATSKPCPGTFYHGFFSGLKATNVTCGTARDVLKRWMRVTGFDKGHGAQPGRVQFQQWVCVLRITGETGITSCRARDYRVSWRGHP